MVFQKIFSYLLVPPGILLLLVLLGLFVRRKRSFSLFLALVLYVLSSYLGELIFLYPLERRMVISPSLPLNAYVVILGGGIERNTRMGDQPGIATSTRILAGAKLYRTLRTKVVVTGGSLVKGIPEAWVMREELIELGVPEDDILVEDKSKNTYENAKNTRELVGDSPIILVTDSLHMCRALTTFRKFFREVHPHPALFFFGDPEFVDFLPNAYSLYLNSRAIYEWMGMIWYRLKR